MATELAWGIEEKSHSHVMTCPNYEDLRAERDLKINNDLVNYIHDVMDRWKKIKKGNWMLAKCGTRLSSAKLPDLTGRLSYIH